MFNRILACCPVTNITYGLTKHAGNQEIHAHLEQYYCGWERLLRHWNGGQAQREATTFVDGDGFALRLVLFDKHRIEVNVGFKVGESQNSVWSR